jgi:hypothetical protein
MIIENSHNVKTNLSNSVEFGLSENSAHIFSMLSAFLYKEKERSVITELCSNALDAHKMVGKDAQPIKVQLPTDLQKEFKVRDFGPGLSEAHVYQFLTKYGSSSKGATNDFIGGFGIGSKSPAAVSDTWTIISHHDGAETNYLIHINDKGVPSINKLYSKPSTETGLEVIIPTKGTYEWRDAASKTFEYYDVKPEVKGANISMQTPKIEYDFHGLYRIIVGYQGRHSVLMNRRAYQLINDQVTLLPWFTEHVMYPFTTSSLSVSLSREDLQYDSKTKAGVEARKGEIETLLLAEWIAEVSPAKTVFQYRLNAEKFMKLRFLNARAGTWLAHAANDAYAVNINFDKLSSFSFELGVNAIPVLQHVGASKTKELKIGRYFQGAGQVNLSKNSTSNEVTINFTTKTEHAILFVLKDASSDSHRCRHAYQNNLLHKDVETILLVDGNIWNKIPNDFYKMKASDMFKPQIVRVAKTKVASELYQLVGRTFERVLESTLDTTTVPTVCIKFTKATTSQSIESSAHINFQHAFVGKVNMIFVKVGKDIPAWTMTPEQWAEAEYKKLESQKADIVMAHKKVTIQSTKNTSYGQVGLINYIVSSQSARQANMTKNTVFGKICKDVDTIMNYSVDTNARFLYDMLNKLTKFLNKPAVQIDMKFNVEDAYLKELRLAYPMFQFVSSYFRTEEAVQAIEYFNQVGI